MMTLRLLRQFNKLRQLCAVLFSSALLIASASPQDFPNKPIKYVVPFPAGGLTDVMARLVGQKVGEALKQTVIVDNKPGANANLGADFVAKSSPDGNTWLAITLAHAVNQSLFPNLPYSLEKNLAPVAHLANSPLVLVVNANHPAKDFKSFLSWAAGKKLNGGSSGTGTPPHLGLELLAINTKIEITHVPYKGGAPSLIDLLGGQIDFIVSNLPESNPHIKSGKLRALAITSNKRHALLPNVPTFNELGLSGMELENWTGLVVPAGTPKAVIERIAKEALNAVRSKEFSEKMAAQGFSVTGLGSTEFASIIAKDVVRWREIIKTRNIKAE